MRVKAWISWKESEDRKCSFGGMGGWFNAGAIHGKPKKPEGHRWADYVEGMDDEALGYSEALRASILGNKIRRGGDWHQDSDVGVPLFDDGTVAQFTYRAWGDLLAAVWSTADDEDYNYMDFYMGDFTGRPGAASSK